jgi:hypothetical protein
MKDIRHHLAWQVLEAFGLKMETAASLDYGYKNWEIF